MASALTVYQLNEKRPWSEFRPIMASLIIGLHLLAAIAIIWHIAVGMWPSVAVIITGVVMYIITGFGVALGYHRLFTHRGYSCGPVLKAILLIAAGLSLEGPVDTWVRTHKLHHAHSDQPGDAHSPFQYYGSPWLKLKGVLWSHVGWLFYEYKLPPRGERGDSIDRDRMMQFQSRHYLWLIVATLGLPAFVGGAAGYVAGGWREMLMQALDGTLVAGVLRIVLFLNVTWSVNSLCHLVGERMTIQVTERRPGQPAVGTYYPSDGSRNAPWFWKWLGFGEPNHALHHLFEQIAYHGWRKRDVDPTKWLLILLERLRLVWDVKKPPEFTVLPLEVRLPEDSFIKDLKKDLAPVA